MANSKPDDYAGLLLQHLPFIERQAIKLAHRDALSDDDVQDFISWATAKFVENDYEILRKFRGDAQLTTYLTVVLRRLYEDFRVALHARWRVSADARQLGPTAVLLEELIRRDGYTADEAIHVLLSRGDTANLTERDLREVLAKLPLTGRGRPRYVPDTALESTSDAVETDDDTSASEQAQRAAVRRVLERAISELPAGDAAILKMHFFDHVAFAKIARILDLELKPLYRRVNRLLKRLRPEFEAAGVTRDLIERLDFDWLEEGKTQELPSAEPSRVSVIADLNTLPLEVVAELMASLDDLHRAYGGGGLRILRANSGSAVPEGVSV